MAKDEDFPNNNPSWRPETALVHATKGEADELGELRPLATLQADSHSFDWSAYFAALGISTQVQQVNLVDPDYFLGLEAELSTRAWLNR